MFIGRKKELVFLEKFYQQEGFGLTVVYGRRRIGKSTLITQFVQNKRSIFYTATKVGGGRNLELFADEVTNQLYPELYGISFHSLESVFDLINQKLSSDKLVLVIDELPYWADNDSSLLSVLQKYIDTVWNDKNLKIILCGSSLSFMEDQVLSEKSPLFGRRNSQLKIDAFDYQEAALFTPNYSYEEKAIVYGITGGVAKYLSLIDPSKSLDENIISLFFTTSGYLFDETRNLLTQEFSDVTLVNNIIEQIASGETSLGIISNKVKEREPKVLYSIEKLIKVGLVQKKRCITEEKNKKKTQYTLKDHMFLFWYAFIPKAVSIIEFGRGDDYYYRVVKPRLHDYMGSVFEDMCRHYTLSHGVDNDYGCFITSVGTWWGNELIIDQNGAKNSCTADIDVVAISDVDKVSVIGECKFRNEKIDKSVYDTLVRRGSLIPKKYQVVRYLLFSLSGFSDWFNAVPKSIELISLEKMYE